MFRNVTCACRRSDDEDHGVARDNLFQAVVCVPSTLGGGAAGGGGNGEEERYRRGGKEEIGRGGKEVIQAD
jgi:hypothetical protein